MSTVLPLFRLGDPPEDQACDFIHIETIGSTRDWTIHVHRHRNLFQVLLIERGCGAMTFDAAVNIPFAAPAAILVPATIAHGFRFEPNVTAGWVLTFTEDAAGAMAGQADEAMARLRALAAEPIVPLADGPQLARLSRLCAELSEEHHLARKGHRLAMRGLLALIAVDVVRLAASRARTGSVTLPSGDATVTRLRELVDEFFRRKRQLEFYAEKLGMSVDRLNDHVKRSTGITAGHLIRQRVLSDAKRQLVFTMRPIHEIGEDLAFADPSHFARFFRQQTGIAPHEFRGQRGG